jgi:CubicO group peptidase (beta-lactamase class C family)
MDTAFIYFSSLSKLYPKQRFVTYIQNHVFEPLGMTSSAYIQSDEITSRLLQAVERKADGKLVPAPGALNGLTCSIPDFRALLLDLISPKPKTLKRGNMDMLFEPAFEPSSKALIALRADTENYAAPSGIPKDKVNPTVNYSFGGLLFEDQVSGSPLPVGTLTWNGLPNMAWAIHKEKGLAMLFATQLIPVDDEKTVALMMEFFKGAFAKFG